MEEDIVMTAKRLQQLAVKCEKTGKSCYSFFLSPAEILQAQKAARKANVQFSSFGGYPDAERCIACFYEFDEPQEYPLKAIKLTWPHQKSPEHRDFLGSIMGLGIKRSNIGDIALEEDCAYVFAEQKMADYLAQSLMSAGKVQLQTEIQEILPDISPPQGKEIRDTVMSPRLDAVVAAGFQMSRGNTVELIHSGRVKLRHIPVQKTDAKVSEGDIISVRGFGRLQVEEIGSPTKKGRLPIRLVRYGK